MEAVIFVMDGVLIDTEPVSRKAFQHAYLKNKITFNESIYQKLLGRSLKNIATDISSEYGFGMGEKIIEDRNQVFLTTLTKTQLMLSAVLLH